MYRFRDPHGRVIYVGKAVVLRNRVRSYFNEDRLAEARTGTLIAERVCASTALDPAHLGALDKKITDLSDALAKLGRDTDLRDLLRIIRRPGWTTPAEYAFCVALLDDMQAHVTAIDALSARLLKASLAVGPAA